METWKKKIQVSMETMLCAMMLNHECQTLRSWENGRAVLKACCYWNCWKRLWKDLTAWKDVVNTHGVERTKHGLSDTQTWRNGRHVSLSQQILGVRRGVFIWTNLRFGSRIITASSSLYVCYYIFFPKPQHCSHFTDEETGKVPHLVLVHVAAPYLSRVLS